MNIAIGLGLLVNIALVIGIYKLRRLEKEIRKNT